MTAPCPNCKKKTNLTIKGNNIPLVNNFKKDQKLYNTDFYFCKKCDLGFLKYFHSDKKLYNKNYLYKGQLNKSKIKFISHVLKDDIKKNISILEIGGGDGYVGKIFSKNIKYTNIDPASYKGFNSRKSFFEKIKIKKKFDIIICLNVLAHINRPQDIIRKLNKISHNKTKIILTVQNSLDQIKLGYLDNIYHEHKYYYSPFSFKNKISNLKFKLNYYRYPLHGESIIATNISLDIKKYLKFKSQINKKVLANSEKKYHNSLKKIKLAIDKSLSKIWGVGCAPRSLKLLYDLENHKKNIIGIIEPKNSPKINLKLPQTDIKIFHKNEKTIGKKYTILWFPWHITPPKFFKKIIWPYH